jgi:glycosyltransferase involved in cell wall biosynthesis/GNAT superfamily N-acetyltransferase
MKPPRIAHVTTVDMTLRYLLLEQMQHERACGFDITAVSAPGPWVADVEAAGITHIPWPHATRAWSPASDLRAAWELVEILRAERFDLVHTHTPKAGVLGRLVARACGVPAIVNTVHGFYAQPDDPLRRRGPVLALERLAARASHAELYRSGADLAWFRPPHGAYLGAGVDVSVQPGVERRNGVVTVGTVCRLVGEKGVREFIAAARALASDRLRFVAVGAADVDKPDALSAVELERARPYVEFTGWREDAVELMADMDVFVLASWREGVPRAVLEAAALGRALVLTDISGCREIARDGVEAVFVPPRDAFRLTEAIARVAADEKLRRSLGAAARARVVEHFDEQRVFGDVVAQYRRLLGMPTSNAEIALRPASTADAPALARLHRAALPDAFMSGLGVRFLRRFYGALLDDPGSTVVVAEADGAVVGFAAGAASLPSFARRFALYALPSLVRPRQLRRALESARYARRRGDLPEAELISVAVAPSIRGRGVGRKLVTDVVASLGDLGAHAVSAYSAETNDAASRLFRGSRFAHGGRIAVHRETASNVWIAQCPS